MKSRLTFVVHARRKRDSLGSGRYTVSYWQTYLGEPRQTNALFGTDEVHDIPGGIRRGSGYIATRLRRFRLGLLPL